MEYNSYLFQIPPEAHADATKFTRTGRAYTPKEKKEYQKELLGSCRTLHEDFPTPITTPVVAVWTFLVKRPSSIKKGIIVKSTKPDTDGFLKVPKDVIQLGKLSLKSKDPLIGLGILVNDSQIFCELTQKLYVSSSKHVGISLILWTNTLTKTFPWRVCPKELLRSILITTGGLD